MHAIRRQMMIGAMKLFDLALMVVAFGIATSPVLAKVGPVSFAQFLSIRIKVENLIVFLVLLCIWHFIFSMLGLYGSMRLASRRKEAGDVIKATSLSALVLLAASLLLRFQMVTPSFVLIFWVFSTSVAVLSRLAVRMWLRRLRIHGRNLRNVLVVGSNRRAIEFAKSIRSKPELGYCVIGFADEDWAEVGELQRWGYSRVCKLAEVPAFIRSHVVDEVVLAVPLRSFHDLASEIAAKCEEQGIILRVLSDLFNLRNQRPVSDDFDGSALVTHYTSREEGWPMVIKRVLDFSLSALLLVGIAPVLLLTAVLIKLTSPGPVFFVQRRVGLGKRIFNIFKFRTMIANAEEKQGEIEHLNEVSGPVFKIKKDPRITPLGRFLRKTSIDELPQLFNVLSGDMSLVGPRPLPIRDYELFSEAGEDWQRCRFSVRPGITCLWQVKGRSSLPFHKWMELDLQYVRTWSLWLDLQILARTIPAVLRGSGAA
jgi:exopolysaccharide biosynthesis polyprenyl glycosylphosphotransferase